MIPEALELVVNGVTLVAPCIRFELYLERWDASVLLDFYDRGRSALRDLTHFSEGYVARKLTPEADAKLRARLATLKPDERWQLEFRAHRRNMTPASMLMTIHPSIPPVSAVTPDLFRERMRALYEPQAGQVNDQVMVAPLTRLQVTFPWAHRLAEPDALVGWLLNLRAVAAWEFASGFCGYAINHNLNSQLEPYRTPLLETLERTATRYPGVDIDFGYEGQMKRYDSAVMRQKARFLPLSKRVNWLTFLSAITLQYLGGLDALRDALKDFPEVTPYPLQDGVAVRAGERPATLDAGEPASERLTALYRALGRFILPVKKQPRPPSTHLDHALNAWLRYFD